MFKDYKTLFKQLREAQEKLWADSTNWTSGNKTPLPVEGWQHGMFEDLNTWAQQAVEQSLELQRAWLDQWSGRATDKKVKHKLFSELNAEAQRSAQRWLEHQQDLWTRWLDIVRSSGTQLPGHAEFDSAFRDATQRQMDLLTQWSSLGDTDALSMKEMSKVADQITKSLQQSIDTHQKLWSSWFDGFQQAASVMSSAVSIEEAPAVAKKASKPVTSVSSDDDLKQISGIGPGLEKKLKAQGYTSLAQLAALTDEQIDELEKTVIRFPGRIKRDDWKGQAQKLIG